MAGKWGSRRHSDREAGKPSPLARAAPTLITVMSIVAGLTAMKFAFDGRIVGAVWLVFLAAVLDGLDGRVARRLNAASRFGAEMDNLADVTAFGVAPAMVLHEYALHRLGDLGWCFAVAFAVCCALRLARFLSARESPDRPAWTKNYFQGIPAPAAAMTALLPIMLFVGLDVAAAGSPVFVAAWTAAVACLMISTLPVYSLKGLRIRREWRPFLLIVPAGAAGGLVLAPMETLAISVLCFLSTIPFSIATYRRHRLTGVPVDPDLEHDDGEDEDDDVHA